MAYHRDFNKMSGIDGFSAESVGQSVAQKSSLFSKLNTSGVKTNVAADTSVGVKADVAGASGVAANAQAGLAGAGADVDRQFAAGMEVLEDRQNEIRASAQVNNVDAGEAFPDRAMAPNSLAEFAVGAVEIKSTMPLMAAAMGHSANVLSIANDVAAGMRGRPAEEIKDAIRETLVSSSSPDNDPNTFAGVIVNSGEAATGVATPVDWEQVFEEHPDALEQIMYASKDNLEAFPELAALQAAGEQIDTKIAEMQVVQDEAEQYGFSADGVEIAGELPPAEIVTADADDPLSLGRIAIASLDAAERDRIMGAGKDLSRDDDGAGFDREAELLALARTSAFETTVGA